MYWSWVLGMLGILGVFALYVAGRKSPWGWLLASCIQGVWIIYALTIFAIWVYSFKYRFWRNQFLQFPQMAETKKRRCVMINI